MTRIGIAPTLAAAVLLWTGCGGPAERSDVALTFELDAAVVPHEHALPGLHGGPPRPVAALRDDEGSQIDFVANELVVWTDDADELAALLARWDGDLLDTVEPREVGIESPALHLIRIDTSRADVAHLADDLLMLEDASVGQFQVSSEEGMELLAAYARESAGAGAAVMPNWLTRVAHAPLTETREAPAGPSAYQPNAFEWPYMRSGSVQDIGVADAWRALEAAGVIQRDQFGLLRSDDPVTVIVVDGGFAMNMDIPPGSVLPLGPNHYRCNGDDCPWHGMDVIMAGMGLVDNGFGGAGPAGPVARAVGVRAPEFSKSIWGVVRGIVDTIRFALDTISGFGAGGRIVNFSGGAPIPRELVPTGSPQHLLVHNFFAGLRTSGVLMFAAAGNAGADVDRRRLGLYEKYTYFPCEMSGVICVGGLAWDSVARHGDSNYGSRRSGNTVDIFAPYEVWLGPNLLHQDAVGALPNRARLGRGTSFSAPFAAGVAALVWAADPSLSAHGVARILFDTAHRHSDDETVPRWVNAFGAVQAALGDVPPIVEITAPGAAGTELDLNLAFPFMARTFDFEDGVDCCNVTWSSDVDGLLGAGSGPNHERLHAFVSEGPRIVSASARDSAGNVSVASVALTVVNSPPTVSVVSPGSGTEVFRDAPVALRATSFDLNEPGGALACTALTWSSNVPGDPFPAVGCDVEVSLPSVGTRIITVTGSDPQGASGTDSVTIHVLEPPPNLPPVVRITSPSADTLFSLHETLLLDGTATDPEGDAIVAYEWSVEWTVNDVEHGPSLIGTAQSLPWTPFDTLGGVSGDYVVTLWFGASDEHGNTGSDSVRFEFAWVN